MCKPITEQEAKEKFIEHMSNLIDYWEKEDRAPTSRKKLEGLMFSILSTLDGEDTELPGYHLIPLTSSMEDKQYFEEQGENYYPGGIDIAGNLHELFARKCGGT